MEASSDNLVQTPDSDLNEDLISFRGRARDMLTERRTRLIDLQKQISEQTRTLAGDLQLERSRLDSEQSSLEAHRNEIQQQLQQLESLQTALSSDRSEWDTHQTSVIGRQEKLLSALADQYERLEVVREDLTSRESAFHEQQLRFEHEQTTFFSLQMQQAEREEELDTASSQLKSANAELLEQQEQLEAQQSSLQQQQAKLAEVKAQCESHEREVQSLQEKTQRQRKQLAAQLRQSRAEAIADVQQRKAELDSVSQADESQLGHELELSQKQCHELRDDIAKRESRIEEFQRQLAKTEEQLAQAREKYEQAQADLLKKSEQFEQLKQQLEESLRKHDVYESKLEDRLAQLSDLREENQKLRDSAAAENDDLASARSELERVRGQVEVFQQQQTDTRDTLRQKEEEIKNLQHDAQQARSNQASEIGLRKQIEQLTRERQAIQDKLDSVQQSSPTEEEPQPADVQLLEQRLEATTQEIRELKQANRDLQEKLRVGTKPSAPAAPAPTGGGLDWEAQKQRLLAQLEDEAEEENDISHERQRERLKIEETIRVTDRVIADKEEELNELRQLLEDQSSNIGEVAVGASAIAAMLDSDELIREERESLKHIQEQWREKLRQAELDVSVERAKVAREHSELDDKIEQFDKMRTKLEKELREGAADPAKKPNKRKWMDRLGIKSDD